MIDYLNEVYFKRLNRYGLDYQSRVQNKREKEFEDYLLKSVYRVDFKFDNDEEAGILETYKQDETQTLQYLLTRRYLEIPNGTILSIKTQNGLELKWLVYWKEEIQASGYNKYTVLKMTHYLKWKNREGKSCHSWAYLYGQEDNMLKDEIRSRSRMDTIYTENLKMSFFIIPTTSDLRKDDYLEIEYKGLKEAYRVTGYDFISTPGIEYVTVDPVYLRDHSPIPEQTDEDNPDDFYWLNHRG